VTLATILPLSGAMVNIGLIEHNPKLQASNRFQSGRLLDDSDRGEVIGVMKVRLPVLDNYLYRQVSSSRLKL